MSMQSEGKDAKGRNYDQVTKDGTGSAAGMGTGSTGDSGAMGADQRAGQGNRQSASRSDDLLATSKEEADQAFCGGSSQGGQIQTGMEGIGKGAGAHRQSGQPANQQSGQQSGQQGGRQSGPPAARQGNLPSGETDPDQYDQGTAPREP